MSECHPRLSIIPALATLAIVMASPGGSVAHAQFFNFFSPPQQVNTPRGSIQLAPGWRAATPPIRTTQGYRVAVRSEAGEQRNMVIGPYGAFDLGRAYPPRLPQATARPAPPHELRTRKPEPPKPKIKVAALRPFAKPPATTARHTKAEPAAYSIAPAKPMPPRPQSTDPDQKSQSITPIGPQEPGYAHGVPINPLD